MTTEPQNKVKIEEAFSMFNEQQIEAIKLIIRKGHWGDTDLKFTDNKEYYAEGYCTNMGKGKEYSGLMSGISKKVKASGTNLILMCSDWWGDGNKDGDMMFFNMELLDEAELMNWSNQ
jgi:hypothetical protein